MVAEVSWFDQILNYALPPILICFIGWILYNPFKKPLSGLWEKIGDMWEGVKHGKSKIETTKYINYQ